MAKCRIEIKLYENLGTGSDTSHHYTRSAAAMIRRHIQLPHADLMRFIESITIVFDDNPPPAPLLDSTPENT